MKRNGAWYSHGKKNKLSKQKIEGKLREKSHRGIAIACSRFAKSNNRTPELNRTNVGRASSDSESGRAMCRDKLAHVTRSKVSGVSSKCEKRSIKKRLTRKDIRNERSEKYKCKIRILQSNKEQK